MALNKKTEREKTKKRVPLETTALKPKKKLKVFLPKKFTKRFAISPKKVPTVCPFKINVIWTFL